MIYFELIKKYLWAVRLGVVVLCAYLSANAVSIYLRGALAVQPTINMAAGGAATNAYSSINDFDIVVKRSLFYSAGMNMEASLNKKDKGPLITSDDFVLLGVVAGLPEISYALINTKHDSRTEVYKVGDKVAGEAEVLAIRGREVELLHQGSHKIIKLPELGTAQLLGDRWDKTKGTQVADGIKKVGQNDFVVDSSVIENAFEDMASMMRGARIMPKIENGQIVGFKLMRIKKDSLYGKIGLQNGDVLHRVNSVEIKGPEDGLRLFQELRTAKNISIDVTRGGQKQTLSYTVK